MHERARELAAPSRPHAGADAGRAGERAADVEPVVDELASLDTPDERLQDADDRAGRAPARLHPRGPANRGGVAAGDRLPHRGRPHHRRQAAGVHPALRRPRRVDADDHVNNEADGRRTEATVFGPFFVEDSPRVELGGDIAGGAPGEPCWVEGTVTDIDGRPVPGARIEVWEADEDGFYDVQYDGRPHRRAAATSFADDDGRYRFWALTPTPYPIPADGPVGDLLAAAGRSPMRAPHLHFMVSEPGCARWSRTSSWPGTILGADSVFGVQRLAGQAVRSAPAGRRRRTAGSSTGRWTPGPLRHRPRRRRPRLSPAARDDPHPRSAPWHGGGWAGDRDP